MLQSLRITNNKVSFKKLVCKRNKNTFGSVNTAHQCTDRQRLQTNHNIIILLALQPYCIITHTSHCIKPIHIEAIDRQYPPSWAPLIVGTLYTLQP